MSHKLSDRVAMAEGPSRELDAEETRILSRLDCSGQCWLWTGALDQRRRGRVWHKGRIKIHHRAVWEILVGPIPDGALLCHHCDNPQCANPDHLYVGDDKTNVRDMFERGRHWTQREPERARRVGEANGRRNNWASGRMNPKAKLTEEQVSVIRESRTPTRYLSAEYGVSRTTIQRIRSGALWPPFARGGCDD